MGNEIEIYNKIATLIECALARVATTINLAMVYTYYEIGKYIFEEEQMGNQRAEYGKTILQDLAKQLTEQFGKGFSYSNLKRFRQFYHVYSNNKISSTPLSQFDLSWSHYQILMKIESEQERTFYEIECKDQDWSVRHLQRQYNSSLYERLALSRNKDEVLKLSQQGQIIEKAQDIIKNPFTLEFLGLKEESAYSESILENTIITKLQEFLLELGKGFLFEARQKRFTFDEKMFFVDLVFYNRLLQCYVLVDLKIDELSHQDLGQMQMYVNYFDRYVKKEFEKPTIGILLCKKKTDALVELTLPKGTNIQASEYSLYLPDKKLLQRKLKVWSEEFNDTQEKE